jgi:hypothetical protein
MKTRKLKPRPWWKFWKKNEYENINTFNFKAAIAPQTKVRNL